ncbi:hypothetical protein Ddye_032347 [Dipteronia dyeriana]|uniref:DUF4378 domain-containing protein n=1 Tax=Dipteronia dyeriana TaxID=168575 RepID=A0AAD9TL74_9ROSI|nr:hypothetical protein Ddye_032347 [Dipteronia dyeriana]
MSTNMESKQHTPSVIARLMGLDEQPPPCQPVQKKRRVLSENYRRRVASIGVREKCSSEACPLFRLGIEEKQKLKRKKDVNLSLSKAQMALLSQSHGDAKRVSVDKNSQMSKEDYDGLGILGSKMDLFIKYLQEPDSSSCKHLHDLQGIRYHSQSRLQIGLVEDSHGELGLGKKHKFLRYQPKSDNGVCRPSTKIVVLKQKLGKTDNPARYVISTSSQRDSHSIIKKHTASHSPEHGNSFSQEKEMKNVAKNVDPLWRRSRFSKEINEQTGYGKTSLSTRVSKLGIRGSDTFAEESDPMIVSSPNTSDEENQYEPSFYNSAWSYVAMEAKKDIFRGWKTNKKFQEVGVTSKLDMPDHEPRCRRLNVRLGENANRLQHWPRKQIHNKKDGSESRNTGSGCMMSLSFPCLEVGNNYSLRSNVVLQRELKRKLEEKDQCEQTSVVCNSTTSVKEEQIMLEERNMSEENSPRTRSSVTSVAPDIMASGMETSAEAEDVGMTSENHKEHHFKPTDFPLLSINDNVSSSVPNSSAQQDMSIGISEEDSVSSFCSCADPESLVNSEEAYQPSPNSVLEPPFDKEISYGSECFRGVDASLHGLQLQLELLKSESEAYSEGTGMIVSSDDNSVEGSISNFEETAKSMKIFSVEETRDYSYMVDVFTEAGFHGTNLDTGYNTGHSPDCPISPAVFEMVEKKYGEQISWKRSDRRLLFDRINSELTEILQPSIGTLQWTKPVCRRLSYRKSLEAIDEEVWILLLNNDSSLKLLGKDDGWLELGDDMEGIVREIENSLIDELATEVISMESF